VAGLAALQPRPLIAITTNRVGLDRLAAPLAAAGLDRVNVSLDTIDQQEFFQLTRRDRLVDVEMGLKPAASVGLTPRSQRRGDAWHQRSQRSRGVGVVL
jgi:cyclic pyranopterin phosphate synthase